MKVTTVAVLASATATAAIGLAPTALADPYQQFSSPSGNIRCLVQSLQERPPTAMCQIGDHTYDVPPGAAKDQNGGPCPPGSDLGRDIRLDQGKGAYVTCTYSALASGFGPWPVLDYGQVRSLGAITCESERDGVTCTDTGSGHFFRLSQESYDVG